MNAPEHGTAQALYQAGKLADAIQAALADVRNHPADIGPRGFLCELLCFAGDLDRADKQLDVITTQDPQAALGVALFRQLLRAERSRMEFYNDGHVPEFIEGPTAVDELHLQASICVREGDAAGARQLLEQAAEQRPPIRGMVDDQPFEGLRDLDDLNASFLEVLTSTGKYYWIPFEKIELIEFRPLEHPRDLLWPRVHMIVRGGPDGEVYLPAIYSQTYRQDDEQLKLGRATDWSGDDESLVRGLGQRTLLFGDDDRPLLSLKTVTIES